MYKTDKTSPGLRNTKVRCEWVYEFGAKCTNELTPNEINYCNTHMSDCNFKKLCYNHQQQQKKILDGKYKEGFASPKDYGHY